MARTKVILNNEGFRRLRTSQKVREFVHEQAKEMAEIANSTASSLTSMKGSRRKVTAEITENPRNRARSAIVGPSAAEDAMLMALGQLSGRQLYTTKAGKTRLATDAQVANWSRGRS